MGREFELKFRADVETIALIREKYGSFTSISMETTYYDTFDLKLAMHRWTLRRRMENGVSVCTFKRPHKDGGRGEWEVECPNIMEGILALCKAGADEELLRVTAGGLMEVCGARFTRLAKTLEIPGGTVELALDQGVLLGKGKGKELPLAEVEVELKEGTDEAAVAFAKALAEEFSLVPEEKSKFVRAMALAMM
ncbi:MAG: CYTH domain-containing protein [Oscillospiraceae bacterium]|nr:CYTH domain-containing protein [Oscillospiraceae bacterium]